MALGGLLAAGFVRRNSRIAPYETRCEKGRYGHMEDLPGNESTELRGHHGVLTPPWRAIFNIVPFQQFSKSHLPKRR